MSRSATMERVCLIGSGNWGSAISRIVGQNASRSERIESEVKMWVYEEDVDGRKLTEIINTDHQNVKYLPGVELPENIVAVPDLAVACKGATLVVFVLPHQFLPRLLPTIKDNVAEGVRAISLIKGIDFTDHGLALVSDTIREGFGGDVPVSVLMGANVASEVAKDEFAEATIGCASAGDAKLWKQLFHTPFFRVNTVTDCATVELCGALKNVVALAAGFCDGLGLGGNSKAALIRIGLREMISFCQKFYEGSKLDTFFESCGVADLITTCYGGRNRKCAEAFAKAGGEVSWEELEVSMLKGQKLQGTLVAKQLHVLIEKHKAHAMFPLFVRVYQIAFEGKPVEQIVHLDESPDTEAAPAEGAGRGAGSCE